MSATFKNARKKLSQSELRKLMHEHKTKAQPASKITSPLAKYNEAGQLMCILCQSVVRSEAVWNVHINAKQHRQNVEQAKALKEKTNNFTTAAKRPPSPTLPSSTKKLKGILKTSSSQQVQIVIAPSRINVIEKKPEETPSKQTNNIGPLPQDFFDASPSIKKPSATKQNKNKPVQNDERMEVDEVDVANEQLPEGFFDDPKLDAKARNIEFKDPIEEEWERFQKEIKDADYASAAIIAEDQEEATTERQMDEIEEQMKNWSRVVQLERKKVEIIQQASDVHMSVNNEEESSSSDEEIDEFLDWRAKKAYK